MRATASSCRSSRCSRRWASRRSPTRRSRPGSSRSDWAGAGTRPTSSTPRVAVVTPIGLDHAEFLGLDVVAIAKEKAGIIKAGAVAVLAAQEDKAVAEVLLERCVEVDAQVAREGAEFGVREREIAVGGQRITLQGLGGTYRRHLPAAARGAPGPQRGAGAGRHRGARRGRTAPTAGPGRRPRGLRRSVLTRPARATGRRSGGADRARATPRTTRTAPARSRPPSPPSSGSRGSSA